MLIRKNTKEFKTILEIFNACRDRQDRQQLIRVFITKAGDTVSQRINVEGIEGGAGLFYEMNYQAVLGNLKSSNHQLHQSDEIPGVYFFRSSSNKTWDESPFEFDEAIKKEFASLPDLPTLRKKEKTEKFAFPAAKMKVNKSGEKEKTQSKKEKTHIRKASPSARTETSEGKKSAKVVDLWPKQPDYKLKQEIHFTGLDRIVFRGAQLTKKDVLDYYDKITDYLLPYLKDRPQVIRLYRDGHQGPSHTTLGSLTKNSPEEIPEWIQTAPAGKGKTQEQLLVCNDREHLLFFVQIGCVEFQACPSRIRSLDAPDYIILIIESPEYELAKAIDVALAAREIFTGLQLPSFVKTDGASGLHLYIPLDSKSDFATSRNVAEFLCKLIRLKIPELVTLKGSEGPTYGKVLLDYSFNEQNKSIVAPYSLVAGPSANVATPLRWEELTDGLNAEAFDHKSIFKRLKDEGDPFDGLFRKKASADALFERLEENYSFLLGSK